MPVDGAAVVGEDDCVASSSSICMPSFQYWASDGGAEWFVPFCLLGVGGGRLINSW